MSLMNCVMFNRQAASRACSLRFSSSLVILISSPTAKVRQELTQFFTSGSST